MPTAPTPHRVDTAGNCLEDCPFPEHAGPFMVTLHPGLLSALKGWLAEQDLTLSYFPTAPGTEGDMRQYVAIPNENHPLNRGTIADHLIAVPQPGQSRRPSSKRRR